MSIDLKKCLIKAIIFFPLLFFTMEICARLDDLLKYQAPFFADYTFEKMLYTTDKNGRRTGKPNGRFQKWKLNSYGFRGDEVQLKKPDDIIRIACIGASETFGYFESPGKEWPAALSNKLDDYDKDYFEVINTSIPGRQLETNIIHLKECVLRFQPDIIILIPSGLHYLDPGYKEKLNRRKDDDANKKFVNQKKFQLKSKVEFTSRLKPKVRQCIKEFVPDIVRKKIAKYEGMKKFREILNQRGCEPHVDTMTSEAQQIFINDLEIFYNICLEHNVKLIIATVALHLSENNIIEAWRYYPYLTKKGFTEGGMKINQAIVDFANENQIKLVDIARVVPMDDIYQGDYIHFTDKGADIVAKSFAHAIISMDSNN